LIAGGQSLVPLLGFRFARPTVLVDVTALHELDFLRVGADGLAIGALRRHAGLESAAVLDGPWRAVREAAALIGHHPIRIRGTLGGSIAHADPAAELPVVSLALDAEIHVTAPAGRRTIGAAEFFRGPYSTVLQYDELITELRFASPPPGARTVFEEFALQVGGFALVAVCAGLAYEGARCTWARIALGGVGAVPQRAAEAEEILSSASLSATLIESAAMAAARTCTPRADVHASSAYRADLVLELTRRALSRLAADR
jgi:carbon-monoxide dehydrogenase medium subunit/6-hydroxypseudooxynicotine dehydrogenase subunit alpha